jgi:hypothetical protein
MTIIIIILAGAGLWMATRNSAATSAAATGPERSKRRRATLFACAGVLALLVLMKGAGFAAGIGFVFPLLVVLVVFGVLVGTMAFRHVMRTRI